MVPHHCILMRGIDFDATEEDICAAMNRVPTDKKVSVHSVILIRDRKTHDSWGFAFVQFSDVQVKYTYYCTMNAQNLCEIN